VSASFALVGAAVAGNGRSSADSVEKLGFGSAHDPDVGLQTPIK